MGVHLILTTGKSSLYEGLGLDQCDPKEWKQKEREAYRRWMVERVVDFHHSMNISPDIVQIESQFLTIDLTQENTMDLLEARMQRLCEEVIPK